MRDSSINARTNGEAEVEVVKAPKKKLSDCWRNSILGGVIITQLIFFAYLMISDFGRKPLFFSEKPEPLRSIAKIIEEPKPEPKPVPKHLILIQTDDSRKVLRYWEFKEAWIGSSKYDNYWSIKTSDGGEIHMKPIQHFVLLENPTEEIRKQFLVDGE